MVTAPLFRFSPSRLFAASLVAVALIAVPVGGARPCGAFFPTESGTNAVIGAQRAIFVLGRDVISLHLQMSPTADAATDFAWVVPIPAAGGAAGAADGLPTLSLGEADLFDALETLTTPTITIVRDAPSGGIGCGDAGVDAGNGRGGDRAVTRFTGGTLGPYSYDIIAGTDADAIAEWLTTNGYRVPDDLGPALAPYVAGSRFVAIKQRVAAGQAAAIEPLVITFDRPLGATVSYPFALSRLSSPARAPFVIWTIADRRHRIVNYGSVELARIGDVMAAEGLSYNDAFRWLTDRADGRLVVTEFAKDLGASAASLPPSLAALITADRGYVTRLFGDTPLSAMEDLVITHAPNAPEVEPELVVTASVDATDVGHTAGGALVLFIVFGAFKRRRRHA